MLQGVDLWEGYGSVEWTTASKTVRFAYLKCTTGNEPGVDAQFAANMAGCDANGVPCGSYHYCFCLPPHPDHPGRSPEEEAARHFAACRGLGTRTGDLAPCVDAEHPAPKDFDDYPGGTSKFKDGNIPGCTRSQVSAWLRAHCEETTRLWGRKPVIYTYPDYWKWLESGADMSWASEYMVDFADYDHPGPGMPPDGANPSHWGWVSKTWTDWAAWQYSAGGSTATIPGIHACPIDRECVRDENALLRLRGLPEVQTAAPLPSAPIIHPNEFGPFPTDDANEDELDP